MRLWRMLEIRSVSRPEDYYLRSSGAPPVAVRSSKILIINAVPFTRLSDIGNLSSYIVCLVSMYIEKNNILLYPRMRLTNPNLNL